MPRQECADRHGAGVGTRCDTDPSRHLDVLREKALPYMLDHTFPPDLRLLLARLTASGARANRCATPKDAAAVQKNACVAARFL